jgi:alcohol dehydrogenase class IV
MTPVRYTAVSYPLRVHAGHGALDALPAEVERLHAQRVFMLCGRSVGQGDLPARLAGGVGHRWAGYYAGIGKDAPLDDVRRAVQAAREAGADMLVAVGAGSVLKAARVAAILLAEPGDVDQLVTRYPPGAMPVSPRLDAPKLPIVNVLTAATSAQNRAGAALKHPKGGARLEFYDPKTRPRAIFWDPEALATAPPSLALSTGVSVYWRALMNMGACDWANPLVRASRREAFAVARDALAHLRGPADMAARMDLCAAALLQNRDEDDGGRPFDVHGIAQVVYALAAALFNHVAHIGQAQAHAALTPAAIRVFGPACPEAVRGMGRALGLAQDDEMPADSTQAVAAAVAGVFAGLDMPARLRDLGVPRHALEEVLQLSVNNFNADRAGRLPSHEDSLRAVLQQSW